MATLKEANEARKRHASRLRRLGAHSIEVRSGKSLGIAGHVVVVHVSKGFRGGLPAKLSYTLDETKVTVRVAVEEKETFRAE